MIIKIEDVLINTDHIVHILYNKSESEVQIVMTRATDSRVAWPCHSEEHAQEIIYEIYLDIKKGMGGKL